MKALVTGITGQDGSFLAELLLEKGYEVHGIVRRRSNPRIDNIAHIADRLTLHTADICDQGSVDRVMSTVAPDECYHLAAQSFVAPSFTQPAYTLQATGFGVLHMLESVKHVSPKTKLYVAGSSEQFGHTPPPHNEDARFYPRSPYGCAKVLAHDLTRLYRESYELFCCVGILGNHESERRGVEFVTRKISMGVAKIKLGLADHIELGNLLAKRDWGYAGDYVKAMWMMLQADTPKDYVIGTGVDHSVHDFVVSALKAAGLQPDVQRYVKVNKDYYRPAEVNVLRLDATRARNELGWVPTVTFYELVQRMVENDIKLLETNGEVQYA